LIDAGVCSRRTAKSRDKTESKDQRLDHNSPRF
jgi:hypothetical protein